MKKSLFNLTVFAICFTATLTAQTAGTLTFSCNIPTPTSPAPSTGGKALYAIWIENSAGLFIKTKARYVGSSTKDHLPTWAVKSGGTLSNALAAGCNITDASTGATRSSATSPTAFGMKSIIWDGKNVSGTVNGVTVADGVYNVWVESTWVDSGSNNHQEIASFSFTKGPIADHQTPAGDTYINTVVLDWIPGVAGLNEAALQNPEITIYPNPTNGIFNIDFKKTNTIKVLNTMGMVVFEEKNENTTSGTKHIDLSNFANGIYIINVSNENGASNYKVVLNK